MLVERIALQGNASVSLIEDIPSSQAARAIDNADWTGWKPEAKGVILVRQLSLIIAEELHHEKR